MITDSGDQHCCEKTKVDQISDPFFYFYFRRRKVLEEKKVCFSHAGVVVVVVVVVVESVWIFSAPTTFTVSLHSRTDLLLLFDFFFMRPIAQHMT